MTAIVIFGLGYTGQRLAARLGGAGWRITSTGRAGTLAFDDSDGVRAALAGASHVVSTIPPGAGGDPVLARYGDLLAGKWLGYLSSTGVYGDAGGAWVDESAAVAGRRPERNAADAAWLERGARVFRLPGIYGPGRSPLNRVASGQAHRVNAPGQVFSRCHVDDIVGGVIAGFDAPPGAYNLADDHPCDQNRVVEHAARALGLPLPPFVELAQLSPMARSFYGENRRVANGKAKRVLGWRPTYPDFVAGLAVLSATTSPASATMPPATASGVQR